MDPATAIRPILRTIFCPHRLNRQQASPDNSANGARQPAANEQPQQQLKLTSCNRPVRWIPSGAPIPGLEFAFGQDPVSGSSSGDEAV